MRVISAAALEQLVVNQLGLLGGTGGMESVEAVASLIRRTAGFLCPCPQRAIVDAVTLSGGELLGDDPRETVGDVLDQLLVAGDLVELVESGARKIYLAAPAFSTRRSGSVILQGVVPDQISGLPDDFEEHLVAHGVTRRLRPIPEIDWDPILRGLGFSAVAADHWFGAPAPASPAQHLSRYTNRLANSPPGSDTTGFTILDPAADPTFYQGRIVEAGRSSGAFVGRRAVRYGSPVWCYAEFGNGRVRKLCDLGDDSPGSGASEAWHLQMAIDAVRGTPQRLSERPVGNGIEASEIGLDFYSPLPNWAERRLEALGRRIPKGRGALLSFALPAEEVAEERQFLEKVLWLKLKDT
jgi:hypothetical protein